MIGVDWLTGISQTVETNGDQWKAAPRAYQYLIETYTINFTRQADDGFFIILIDWQKNIQFAYLILCHTVLFPALSNFLLKVVMSICSKFVKNCITGLYKEIHRHKEFGVFFFIAVG